MDAEMKKNLEKMEWPCDSEAGSFAYTTQPGTKLSCQWHLLTYTLHWAESFL